LEAIDDLDLDDLEEKVVQEEEEENQLSNREAVKREKKPIKMRILSKNKL
jgi:hypothetical protein